MILVKNVHNIFGEPTHVFTNDKGQVATLNFLIVEYGAADLVASPLRVCTISEGIDAADKHSNGHGSDGIDRNQIGFSLGANVKEGVVVGRPNLESRLLHVLGVVEDGFGARAVRLVVHVDLEAILVVELSVAGHKELFKSEAEPWDSVADKTRCP